MVKAMTAPVVLGRVGAKAGRKTTGGLFKFARMVLVAIATVVLGFVLRWGWKLVKRLPGLAYTTLRIAVIWADLLFWPALLALAPAATGSAVIDMPIMVAMGANYALRASARKAISVNIAETYRLHYQRKWKPFCRKAGIAGHNERGRLVYPKAWVKAGELLGFWEITRALLHGDMKALRPGWVEYEVRPLTTQVGAGFGQTLNEVLKNHYAWPSSAAPRHTEAQTWILRMMGRRLANRLRVAA